MRKIRAFLLGRRGQTHRYHVVTRTAGQELLFGDQEKETFRQILLKQLKFSGLRAIAWCFMGNHFHVLLEVPDKETALADWSEDDLIERLRVFEDEHSTRLQLAEVAMFRENGHSAGVTAIANRVRARLFDLSMFMKELKLRMTLAYNLAHDRSGTLWEGRFKSVLVEAGEAVKLVAAYIDLNPVRAGIVDDPKDYRWCSYAAAVAGMRTARSGLIKAVTGKDRSSTWSSAASNYRRLLFGIGDATADSLGGRRAGFTRKQVEDVWKAGGKLPLAAALRCHVRYFSDGVALGSKQFIEDFFADKREHFSPKRTAGARRMRGAEWGEIRVLRALRVSPITPPDTGESS